MQAVIRTGGKQYYVGAGDILEVEKLAGDVGDTITLGDVLMIANDDDVTVGQPTVDDAAVTAKITGQYRGNKILVFRYRPKKRIRVRRGHRQYLTRLEIQAVRFGDLESVAPEPVIPVPVAPDPEPIAEEVEAEDVVAEEASSAEETVAEATEEAVEAEDNTAADIVAEVEADADSDDDDSNDDSDAHADDSDTDIDVDADEASDKSKE